MSDYTVAPDGNNSIAVFSRNGNATLYRINLGSDTESINSTILNGNRLSVTRTTTTGNVEYVEYDVRDNQAIKISHKQKIVGHVQKKKEVVRETIVSTPKRKEETVVSKTPSKEKEWSEEEIEETLSYHFPDLYNHCHKPKPLPNIYSYRDKGVVDVFVVYVGMVILWNVYNKLNVKIQGLPTALDQLIAWVVIGGTCFAIPHLVDRLTYKVLGNRRKYIYIGVFYVMNYTWINKYVIHIYNILKEVIK